MQLSLAQEIIQIAVADAIADLRFPLIRLNDLAEMEISTDVLSSPENIETNDQPDPKRDNVFVCADMHWGVLLLDIPQVTTAVQQLAIARRKRGIRPDERSSSIGMKSCGIID